VWTIRQTTEPAYEPVTMERARQHLRLFADDGSHPDDDLVSDYITAARVMAEQFTDRYIVQRALELRADRFSMRMTLPVAPVVSIDSIEYTDTDGASQTFTDYTVDLNAEPATIKIDNPPDIEEGTKVVITVTAGYRSSESPASADLVPQTIKQAILMLVGHFYENREDVVVGTITAKVPMAFEALLWPHRITGV